ncbi:hypothetical protein, partial [Devosia sp.]|uniref:hypothetical protein n=1 Tax=Devosia sp. TaxID=1871048 RepID=UPI002FCB4CFC
GAGYSETPDVETVLVYSGSGRDVQHAWVAGEAIVRDRTLQRRSYDDIRCEYSIIYKDFWSRVEAARKVA